MPTALVSFGKCQTPEEYVYINPTDSVVELRQGISDYIEFYNYERPHQSVGEVLPARSYGLIA